MDFKNTVIILTSNLGSEYLLNGIDDQGEITLEARDNVDKLLKASFRPEFLNRLDEIILFKPLHKNDIDVYKRQGYKYAHDYPGHYVEQQYLPDEVKDEHFYNPGTNGYENTIHGYLKKIGRE